MDLSQGGTQPLIPRFHQLYLAPPQSRRRRRNRRMPPTPRRRSLPTWTQLKTLSLEVASLVAAQGTPHSPSVMFVAMMAILSCQVPVVQPESQVLWAYVPDPPVLRPVTWNDPSFPVYLNDTSVLGFPSSTHITPQSVNYSYVAQAASLTMCFYASRIWNSNNYESRVAVNKPSSPSTLGPYCFKLAWRELFTYEGTNNLRPVSDNISSLQFPKIKRERCRPSNQSLDPSPPWKLCYPTQKQALSYILSTGFTLFDWSVPFHEVPGGWSTPMFTTPSGHVHSSLWKLFTAIIPSLVPAGLRSTSYPTQRTVYVQACVASHYALLYGDIKIAENNEHYSITCSACTLTNCLDSTVFPTPVILIVHQPPYVMLPVNISGPWYNERALQVLNQMRDLMIRPKQFIGLLITSILAIVSIVATAATAAVSLAHSIQNAVYVNHLARNISVAMGTKMDIAKKLETKLNALEETVTILGNKIYNMQNHMALRCHVNFKYICVTNTPYNDTEWQWSLVKAHLQGIWTHNNLSLDVIRLQHQIHTVDISRKELPLDDSIARDISLIGIGVCVLLLIILLPVLFHLVFSSLQQLQLKLFELHLKSKKGGTVGIIP
ncbi:envelope glycoprotein, partial [Plecturocebus cupreus]